MTKLENHRRERYPLLVIRISAFFRNSSFGIRHLPQPLPCLPNELFSVS